MREPSQWEQITAANPNHSTWYVERFRAMAAQGADLDGEARLADAMVPRGARILDAGCGPGRVGAALASRGHTVVGVDVDPVLVEAARADHPGPTWLVGDLAELDLPSRDIPEPFDLVVCAGNVMTFLAPGSEAEVLRRFRAHLAPGGRAVVGFGAGRGYPFERFDADVGAAGLAIDVRLATWDLRPFTASGDFLVAVLSAA
ncbi:Methyltransferase type 12 [Beutenbergia cavernae DSM 12333]|uniref:Methyltransferase type 12 n=1 Tax=Beutenbergia cavernae (strain ATCC BAA-8 / DSM 12333 / CCUG 43141 / JCM 11478 / NBRC 16432 / NCIMB 13614 / HKI 0122) TaxID=471853 RepID=C5BY52_BEUC1|nr:class I SAM-dependent methyltransferase [Beutenbergia cavernae]ACQ80952.1 Methyltransferase type 12 [Beutenbergia cavernae DSM 12333]